MTEQELVNTLKRNGTAHIIYRDLVVYIKEWIDTHRNQVMIMNEDGEWDNEINSDYIIKANDVCALPENYRVKKSGWVEFNINDGIFTGEFGTGEEAFTEDFHWWNWQEFLDQASNNDMGFTAFGGWQYESNGYWLTDLQIIDEKGQFTTLTDYKEDCKPAIPIKIRFWRESR